jgi:putative FmdB family regulatory protein
VPIYEYRCSQCGERFEQLVRKPAEAGTVQCPECHSSTVKKLPSVFALGESRKAGEGRLSCCGSDQPCADPKRCCTQ